MREFKFRVFNPDNSSFVYFTLENSNEVKSRLLCQNEHPVQQFTGLKDKHGKEIYDGDIIRGYMEMGPAGLVSNQWRVAHDALMDYQWGAWDLASVEIIGSCPDA